MVAEADLDTVEPEVAEVVVLAAVVAAVEVVEVVAAVQRQRYC